MKLTVFGGSGRTGIPLIEQALAAGHDVTALVRTPAKLTVQHERLHVLAGDALDAGQVAAAIDGADAVLSVLGQTRPPTKDLLSTAVGNMLAGMAAHNVQRFVYLTGAGVRHPNDTPGLPDKIMGRLLKLMAGEVLADSERAVRAIEASPLDWVIVRAPRLSEERAKGSYRSGYIQPGFAAISRADVAGFMLQQVSDGQFVRQMPVISY